MKRVFGALLFLAALGAVGSLGWKASRTVTASANAPMLPTTKVARGEVAFSVWAKGELQGGNTEMLTVPMTGGQPVAITYLMQPGEAVKPGEVVARLDVTEQEFRLQEAQADLSEAEQQVIQAKAEAEAKEEEARYQLMKAQSDLKIAELETRRNDLLPRIVARQNQLAVEAGRDKLTQLNRELANRLETARSGIAIHEAAVQKARVKAETAQRNIDSMTLKAKSSGYVALQSNDEGMVRWGMYLPPYQVGDIARPGKAVAQIPDLRSWEATARIGELDRGHLKEGQTAEIHIIALPGRVFQGKVKTLGGTTGPPWDRHFDCRVAVTVPASELRPGMSTQVRIATGSLKDVLWIPAQALFDSDGRKYVFVREGAGFRPRDVQLVQRSESQVVVTGVSEGQEVALTNPDQAGSKDTQKGGALQALPKS